MKPKNRVLAAMIALVCVLAATPSFSSAPAVGGPASSGERTETFTLSVTRGRVSLQAVNADLNEVLKALSAKAGLKISMYEKLDERITTDLEGVTIEECLKKISKNYALVYKKRF